jgi:hypothetical protein
MRKVIILSLAALAGCAPAALTRPECLPTVVQPARGAGITLIARVAGCPNLVAVAGAAPGQVLYVSRRTLLGIDSWQIDALPEQQRGL